VGAQILRAMQVSKIRLLSNNPKKRVGLLAYGIEIVESVALEIVSNEHNKFYLQTKRDKLGHSFKNLNE
jgi:3,4-dihydroxy 2-butanone 4-phosphate synthase/GTP cyclohydrolase II